MSGDFATCADCGRDVPNVGGQPCPHCGSRTRAIALSGTVRPVGTLEAFAAWPVRAWKRRRRWLKTGTRIDATGRRVKFRDEYDKDADRRLEHVEDATTGEVVHHVDEPLSQHRGHGSAKRRGANGGANLSESDTT